MIPNIADYGWPAAPVAHSPPKDIHQGAAVLKHLTELVDQLKERVAEQAEEIERLERRVKELEKGNEKP